MNNVGCSAITERKKAGPLLCSGYLLLSSSTVSGSRAAHLLVMPFVTPSSALTSRRLLVLVAAIYAAVRAGLFGASSTGQNMPKLVSTVARS